MTLATVLLTDPMHPEARAHLEKHAHVTMLPEGETGAAAEASLRRMLGDADALIVRRLLPDDLFDTPGRLKAVVRQGVGLDFIPVQRATFAGLPVANTPAVNANAVAEYVFASLLGASRQLAWFDRQVRDGHWQARREAGARTFDLRGRKLGIVGYGAIGRRIGEIASAGFGMRLLSHTSTPSKLPPTIEAVSLQGLFEACDFVVVACPLTAATRGMVDRQVLAHAKAGCVLVNVGRGPVINEGDLADALDAGKLAGAVLDVFENQPLPATSRLRNHPGVTLTPHVAGITQDAERAMGLLAADTALALVRGERPGNVVNPEVWVNTESSAA
ncbi:MAG: hydroxyacid dehydrogenase [Comamonadaceae bacterium]|nr:MAG: hydroxyacid dehydrogenase [Comamonadaceae bacterium]